MADYDNLDEATLQKMAAEAESYEERSAIRQAIRRKKKGRGENVGRARGRGNSVYNRFAGSTAPTKQPSPKNYVVEESSGGGSSPARPPSSGGRGSRGSTTPTQRETPSSPVPRPRTPTPPPTPEQPQQEDDEPVAEEEEEVDIPPAQEEEAPPSPPPSPQPEAEPEEPDGDSKAPLAEIPGEEEEEEKVEQEADVEEEPASPKPPADDVPVSPKDERPSRRDREETDAGGARFGGVTLKSRRSDNTPTASKKTGEPQNEFLNLKLRQTSRDGSGGQRRSDQESKVNFGVKLRSAPKDKPVVSPPPQKRSSERRAEHGAPKTLRDYQELTSKPASRGREKRDQGEEFQPPTMEPDELQMYLVAYVNSELNLHPRLPVKGSALFETCSNPTNLCKLVNKSVPNTVDLRALTKISSSCSESQRTEALKENMTLALESARAIGCRVSDDSIDNILNRHPQTIRDFLVDLIRAKAVNLPGMDEEPSSTFTNMAALFERLSISVGEETVDLGGGEDKEEVTWHDDREKVRKALASPPPQAEEKGTWRETTPTKPVSDTAELSYEERRALRQAKRERQAKQSEESGGVELSYEERAAQRRAERERRRREREALAK